METAPIHYMLSYSSFLKFFRVDWLLNAKELGQKMKKNAQPTSLFPISWFKGCLYEGLLVRE